MDQQPQQPLSGGPDGRQTYKMEVMALLQERGVTLADIAEIVHKIQHKYVPGLTQEDCLDSVDKVIEKREVQHALMTGIVIDRLAETEELPEPLQGIVARDDALYGVDEVMALAITNIYGSIGLSNFGYLDKVKIGVLSRLDSHHQAGAVHTFLDDLIAAVAAAAASRIAHHAAD